MNVKRLKTACYMSNITMALVGNLSPLLFLTFRSMYNISYSLLGLLVLINFCTQLGIDLLFSFFSHKFNIPKAIKAMPLFGALGLFVYAFAPWLFPHHVYGGIVLGTILFSAASGLAEVLISPIIAALPADDPDREMSKLHSVYAWGVVGVVLFSTFFLLVFGTKSWQYLTMILTLIPITAYLLFWGTKIPAMETPEKTSGVLKLMKNSGLWLCVAAIFLGGASEVTMAQWCSGYLEKAMSIPKVWGDVLGVALFSVMLGTGRTLYAKIGKNITKVLFLCMLGATLCYLIAAVSPYPVVGLLACAFTGFCVSMLWPGSLIVASDRFPQGGVFVFALMAAGGDFGASVGPQLVGIVTDFTLQSQKLLVLSENLGIMPEQLGMKLGMLVGMLFPLVGIPVTLALWKNTKNNKA